MQKRKFQSLAIIVPLVKESFSSLKYCENNLSALCDRNFRLRETENKVTILRSGHFSFRCSSEADCRAYQYTASRPNCILIHINSTAENGQTFVSDGQSIIYEKNNGFPLGVNHWYIYELKVAEKSRSQQQKWNILLTCVMY